MRSSVRFVMHPDDEASIVLELLSDPSLQFIDGPRWKTAVPSTSRNLKEIGYYCIVWSPQDLPVLAAKFIPTCNDWYCQSEFATIQFLRSQKLDSILTEGRFAVSTDPLLQLSAHGVQQRFRQLSRIIKKSYKNGVLRWRNPKAPEGPASPARSANPSKPDTSLWIGPAASQWLTADPERRVKQFLTGHVEGQLQL
jgi:hypothetical protein